MMTTVALVVVGVQLNETFTGKLVPRLCAVGKTGSASVNPFTCERACEASASVVISKKNRKYVLICFMIISLGF